MTMTDLRRGKRYQAAAIVYLMRQDGADQTGLAERLVRTCGCPHSNGYPCQGTGDFGAGDKVVTHCPAACWVAVAKGETRGN